VQFDRIAIRIFEENLLAARPSDDVIPKPMARLFQLRDTLGQAVHVQDYAIPPARFRATPIRHRASAGTLRPN
jgi:hypothetical protein